MGKRSFLNASKWWFIISYIMMFIGLVAICFTAGDILDIYENFDSVEGVPEAEGNLLKMAIGLIAPFLKFVTTTLGRVVMLLAAVILFVVIVTIKDRAAKMQSNLFTIFVIIVELAVYAFLYSNADLLIMIVLDVISLFCPEN